jgi:hypothetical protein
MDVPGVSCVTEAFCVAVGIYGEAYTYDGHTWSHYTELGEFAPNAVSCPTTTFCAIGGNFGKVVAYEGGTWSAPVTIDGLAAIRSVSCPSPTFCAAVDSEGNALTYPATSTPPSTGGGGGSTGSPSTSSNPVLPPLGPPDFGPTIVPGPSASAIQAALAGLLRAKVPTIAAMLKAGGANLSFTAPGAGLLSVEWAASGAHKASRTSKPTLIAAATKSFATAGRGTIRVRLTAAGRKLLRRNRTLRLVESAAFTPHGEIVIQRQSITLLRRSR